MSDQNNNQDNWSNRNWQDAGNFGGGGRGGGMFGNSGFGNNGFGNNDNNQQQGMFSGSLFGGNNNGKLGGGWMRSKNSTWVIVVVLVIIIIYTFYTQFQMNATITKSTVERVKIESSFDYRNDPCFFDEFRVVDDENALRKAAKNFHDATGVIPYVYFTESNVDTTPDILKTKAEEFYREIFTDEDHFVIFFDGLQNNFYMGTAVGKNAEKVMDAEAQQIFTDYLTKYYEARQTNNQTYMVNTYRSTAERMMTTLPYSKNSIIFGCIAIAVLIIAILISVKRKADQKTAETNQE